MALKNNCGKLPCEGTPFFVKLRLTWFTPRTRYCASHLFKYKYCLQSMHQKVILMALIYKLIGMLTAALTKKIKSKVIGEILPVERFCQGIGWKAGNQSLFSLFDLICQELDSHCESFYAHSKLRIWRIIWSNCGFCRIVFQYSL